MHRPVDASHGLLEVHSCGEASVNVNASPLFPFPGASGPYLVRVHLEDDRGVRRRAQLAQPHHPSIPALHVDRLEPGAGLAGAPELEREDGQYVREEFRQRLQQDGGPGVRLLPGGLDALDGATEARVVPRAESPTRVRRDLGQALKDDRRCATPSVANGGAA